MAIDRRAMILGSIAAATATMLPAIATAEPGHEEGPRSTLYGFDITWDDDWSLNDAGSHTLPDVGQEHIVLTLNDPFPDGISTRSIDRVRRDPHPGQ